MPASVEPGAYDAHAGAYDVARETPVSVVSEFVAQRCVTDLVGKGGRILDVGAGTGAFAIPFLRQGHPVTLLEPSSAMLAIASRKVREAGLDGAAFLQGSMHAIPHASDSFDLVFSEGDPLSYCGALAAQAARETMRVLAPGGSFYVSCDNRWLAILLMAATGRTTEARIADELGDSLDPYGNRVRAFEPEELRGIFLAAGAIDVRVRGKTSLSHLMPPAVLQDLLASDDTRDWWLDLETRLSQRPEAAGLAAHLHVTGRKPGGGAS